MYLVVIFELFQTLLVFTRKDSTQLEKIEFQLETQTQKNSSSSFNSKLKLDLNRNFELKSRFCLRLIKNYIQNTEI